MADTIFPEENEEAVIIPTIAESWRVPTEAIKEAVDEAISQLPPVNDATLTITQNGTTKGTFTANDADDTTIDLQDTTYEAFVGTDGSQAGSAGLVPAPTAADTDKYLKSDGTWSAGGVEAILYDETGQNTDGAMTQKATTDALDEKQDTLTAGENVSISADNTISATDTTYEDFIGTDGTTAGESGLVPAPATTDADKFLKSDGTWDEVQAGPTVVQATGTSTTSVMSQKATTNMIYPVGSETNKSRINIGSGYCNGGQSVAIGANAKVQYSNISNAVALGANAEAGQSYVVSVGPYGPSTTRIQSRIVNMADPISAQDASTKNYTDNLAISYSALSGSSAPTTATEGKYVGQLYFDTANDKKYYLKAIDTTTDPDTYTWEEFGGGGIPTDATFWGASYDATSNSVNETSVLALRNAGTIATEQLQLKNPNGVVRGGLGLNYTGNQDVFIRSRLNNHNTRTLWGDDLITFASEGSWRAHSIYGVNVSNARIHDVADPAASQDAATKNYVDNLIPTVNNATLTIQRNGTAVQTFTANSATDAVANIDVPTTVAELSDSQDYALAADVASLESSLAPVATSNSFNDLDDQPVIDATISAQSSNAVQNQAVATALATKADTSSIGNGTLTVKRNGTTVATFTANSSTAAEADISVPTAVSQLSDASSYYTKTQVDDAISGAVSASLKYKGSCAFADIPSSGMQVGDVWNITDDFVLDGEPYSAGTNIAWNGTKWDPLAPAIDLSPYELKADVGNGTITVATTTAAVDTFTTNQSANKTITIPAATASAHGTVIVDSALSASSNNPVRNSTIYAAIGDVETILTTLNSGTGA